MRAMAGQATGAARLGRSAAAPREAPATRRSEARPKRSGAEGSASDEAQRGSAEAQRRPCRAISTAMPSHQHDSVAEVALAGEDHGDAVLVGGGDHLVVAHDAAGLDDRGARRPRPPRRGRRGTGRRHRWRTHRRPPARRPSRRRCGPSRRRFCCPAPMPDGLAAVDEHDGVRGHRGGTPARRARGRPTAPRSARPSSRPARPSGRRRPRRRPARGGHRRSMRMSSPRAPGGGADSTRRFFLAASTSRASSS